MREINSCASPSPGSHSLGANARHPLPQGERESYREQKRKSLSRFRAFDRPGLFRRRCADQFSAAAPAGIDSVFNFGGDGAACVVDHSPRAHRARHHQGGQARRRHGLLMTHRGITTCYIFAISALFLPESMILCVAHISECTAVSSSRKSTFRRLAVIEVGGARNRATRALPRCDNLHRARRSLCALRQ